MGNNKSQRIATAVISFVNMVLTNSLTQEFTASELRSYVSSQVDNVAPASADRIMRQLRQNKIVNYVLVKRQQSLYRALPVAVVPEGQ